MQPKEIYNALVHGIARFFEQAGMHKAVLGLSGGIDSALVACLAIDALGVDNVHGLLLPSHCSTVHSLTDALRLCELNGIGYHIIPIDELYSRFEKELAHVFSGTTPDVTEENLQARIRGTLLMAYANKFNALLLNTTNKSELAMGYGTLYGDLAGALMVLADVYKMQIYEVSYYVNSQKERIPQNTLIKEPSAELRMGQKDSDTLPPYPVLDPILRGLIEDKLSPEDLLASEADGTALKLVLSRLHGNTFKGLQTPPLLQITPNPLLPQCKCFDYRS